MTVNDVVSIITSVGFPIVCCGALGWYVKYTVDKFNKTIDEMTARHMEESKATTDALNANTVAIEKLAERLKM